MRTALKCALTPVAAVAVAVVMAGPASAHHCTNPAKDAHAPDAGVNYQIVGFGENGPVLEQIGPGKGIGGFVKLGDDTVFTLGGSDGNGSGVVGGPGSQTEEHECDGKGIDYAHC